MKFNLNSEVSKETLEEIYEQNKIFLAPAATIVVAILLFLFFLLPQFFSFSQKKDVSDVENQKLTQLKNLQTLASSADLTELSSNFSLSSLVLPPTKDFEGVLNTLSTVANDTNVTIESYQLEQAGDTGSLASFPSIEFQVTLIAAPEQTMQFVDELSKKAPISEVQMISGTDTSSSLTIDFFYKPFSPISENSDPNARKMNSRESDTENTISNWNLTSTEIINNQPSSQSAQESGSPF